MIRRLAVALVATGCTIGLPPDPETSGGEEEPVSEIDTVDRCHDVPRACLGLDPSIDDGCPAATPPEIRFAEGASSLDDDAMYALNDLSIDGRALAPGVSLRLVAVSTELSAERIASIRAHLVACGVPDTRITTGGELPAIPAPPAPTSVLVAVDGCSP